jgi:acyl-CoA thioesterase FadM
MGHVNNVTYVRYAESARVNWTRNIGLHIDPANKDKWTNLLNSTGIGLILRSIKIDYKFVSDHNQAPHLPVLIHLPQPMTWPDKITVYQKLVYDPSSAHSSQSAFQLQVMILSEARQRPAARCHEDIVTYDYKKNRKTPELPPFILEQFKTIWELQEKAKKDWQERILEIENRVRTLEVESWDRADAVEDTGSA